MRVHNFSEKEYFNLSRQKTKPSKQFSSATTVFFKRLGFFLTSGVWVTNDKLAKSLQRRMKKTEQGSDPKIEAIYQRIIGGPLSSKVKIPLEDQFKRWQAMSKPVVIPVPDDAPPPPVPPQVKQTPKPPMYYQPKPKNADRVKRDKTFLGKGNMSEGVYAYKDEPGIVVKKGNALIQTKNELDAGAFEKEYHLGASLNHPSIAKSHELWIKKLPSGSIRPKIKMEKIEGRPLSLYYRFGSKLDKEVAIKLIDQARDCFLYLFKEKVIWADLNEGNLFVTKEGNLKICDLGAWFRAEGEHAMDIHTLGLNLLAGGLEIVGWIMKSSVVRARDVQRDLEAQILFPEIFFGKLENPPTQVLSIIPLNYLKDQPWLKAAQDKIKMAKSEEEVIKVVSAYFDSVIQAFYEKVPQTPTDTTASTP